MTVPEAHKRAVWAALAPPARLTWEELAEATGIEKWAVMEVIAKGYEAGAIIINDEDRQHVWFARAEG